jgi:hypothetical protein
MPNANFDQILKTHINENIGKAHDYITNQLILESLIKNGKVTIEEAQFFNKTAFEVLFESSHLLVPSKEEVIAVLEENFNAQMAAGQPAPEAVAPEIPGQESGAPVNLDMPAPDGIPADEPGEMLGQEPEIVDVNGVPYLKQADGSLVPAEAANGGEDMGAGEPTITPNDQDVTDTPVAPEGAIAAGQPGQPGPMNESTEVSGMQELTENELLINKLISTIKG